MAAPSGRRMLRGHWYRSGLAPKVPGRRRIICPADSPVGFPRAPDLYQVNADEASPHRHRGVRMSSQQVSGAIAYQESQGPNQVHRWRAFAVLAVSFFMTVADLAIVNVALPTIGRKLHMPESSLQWVVTGYALT